MKICLISTMAFFAVSSLVFFHNQMVVSGAACIAVIVLAIFAYRNA